MKVLIIIIASIFAAGCFSLPSEKKEASEKKIAAIEKSQATNHVAQAKSGVAMVKAAQ